MTAHSVAGERENSVLFPTFALNTNYSYMKNIDSFRISTALAVATLFVGCFGRDAVGDSDGALTQAPFNRVTLEDDFWLPRLRTQKRTLVPFALDKTEPAVENLRRTGAFLRGEKCELPFVHRYISSDLYKVMEGAAYLLAIEPDPELERRMDDIIDIIAEAQQEDGYLYESHITGVAKHQGCDPFGGGGMGDKPYSWVLHSHELYDMGHMYEGAVAYYQATGKRKWLDVAEKNARHIARVFFEGDPAYNDGEPVNQAPGHQELELALVKMFRVTGDSLYLDMAKRFIDIRGVTFRPEGRGVMAPEYAQQHLPVREQREAVGHAVRAAYMYSAMADVAAATGDSTLMPALESIWHDIVDKKMHITGGLGAVPGIEGFGPEYVLPNKNTYDETCAAVGSVMFNYRMFLLTRDAKYVDVAEAALYNNVLAGVNIEGNRFFYVNPLETDGRKAFNHGRKGRSPWFDTACCPSNMARLIPQVPGMIWSYDEDDVYCSLYAGSSVALPLAGGEVRFTERTAYPFDGDVSIEVDPSVEGEEFTLWLRIPTWCSGKGFVAGKLYSYADGLHPKAEVRVNGKRVRVRADRGFVPVRREWHAGDEVTLSLPMPVRYNVADSRVEADVDRVCFTRGPLVFCAEAVDNEHNVGRYYMKHIGRECEVRPFDDGVLCGVPCVTVEADAAFADSEDTASLKLVPYYAWDNRGDGAMNVWFARSADTARESCAMTTGDIADVRASFTYAEDDEYAVADGKVPSDSHDTSIPRWTSWPRRGEAQTVELVLKKSMPVESVSVYWYNDEGGVKLPVSWSAEYRSDGEWHEFKPYVTDSFGVAGDRFNMVHPSEAITADALRLKIVPRDDAAVGILEAEIN